MQRRFLRLSPAAVEVDPAQGGERHRQHHPVGDHLAADPGEAQGEAAVTAPRQRLERGIEADGAVRKRASEAVDDLVVAPAHVIALVGPLDLAGVEVEEVEGAEPVGIEPELARHLGPDELARASEAAAGNIRVEPLGDAETIERPGRVGRVGVAVWADAPRRRLDPALEARRASRRSGDAAGAVEPEPRAARVRDRVEVDQLELEPTSQRPHPPMAGVDEFATVLGRLRARELARCPAAAADPLGVRLIDRAAEAATLEPVGAGEAGETRADDDDPRSTAGDAARSGERRRREQQRRPAGAGAREQLAPRDPDSIGPG